MHQNIKKLFKAGLSCFCVNRTAITANLDKVTWSCGSAKQAAALLLLAVVSQPVVALEDISPVPLNDSEGGATCLNYSLYGELSWQQKLGDWRDQQGELFGNTAFAKAEVPQQNGLQQISLDVTTLVQKWLQAAESNQGFLLKTAPPNDKGIVNFHSKESELTTARPELVLQFADGRTQKLAAVADTTLDCSSVKSQGQLKVLRVGPNYTSILRFELPKVKVPVTLALLKLSSDKQYAKGATVAVFQTEPLYLRAKNPQQLGLAAKYQQDAQINDDPAVLFSHGFENLLWLKDWSDYSLGSSTSTVQQDKAEAFAPLQGKALKVTLPQGDNMGLDLRYNFVDEGKIEPEEIYFRYYLRFGSSWAPTADGGKLPGIAGTYGKAGWGMRKSDGLNGWSARGGFERRPADPLFANLTAINNYGYHAHMVAPSGDRWSWLQSPRSLLKNNQWYSVEQYVRLNTPGKADGVLKAWVDGYLVLEKTDIVFRHSYALKIETIWLDVYHGGITPSPADMALYIDNVVVATEYIGPMVQ